MPTGCPDTHTLPISLSTMPQPSPSNTKLWHLGLREGPPGSDSPARESALVLRVSLEHSQRMTLLLISLLYSCQSFSAPQWRSGIAPRSCDTLCSCAWCRRRQCACLVVATPALLSDSTVKYSRCAPSNAQVREVHFTVRRSMRSAGRCMYRLLLSRVSQVGVALDSASQSHKGGSE